MDPEVPEDRTEERGGQEHDHHHQSVAQVCTQGGGGMNADIPIRKMYSTLTLK